MASATGWKSSSDEPLRRRDRGGRRARSPRAAQSESRCLRPSRKTGSAPRATATACATSSSRGVRPEPPERREGGEDRVEVGAEPRDLRPREVRHREEVAVGRRPDRLDHVPEVEAAGPERAVLQDGERRRARRANAAEPRADERARDASRSRHRALEQRAPARAEHRLARALLVRRPSGRRRAASASASSPASRRTASASAAGSPGGTRSALSPSVSSSRAAGVSAVTSGVAHASAWNALFGITRAALPAVPKMPERAAGRAVARRAARSYSTHGTCSTFGGPSLEQRRELAAADDAERELGRERAPPRGSSRARAAGSACRRRGRGTAPAGCQPGRKSRSSAPTSATATRSVGSPKALGGRTRACASVSATTRSAARNAPSVDRAQHARRGRAAAGTGRGRRRACRASETSGLKTTGRPRATRLRGGQVEVARVADDDARRRRPRAAARATPLGARRAARAAPSPTDQLCRAPRPSRCRSTTSTPAPRRQEITCAFRG